MKKLVICLMLALLLATAVLGLGIRPAKTTVGQSAQDGLITIVEEIFETFEILLVLQYFQINFPTGNSFNMIEEWLKLYTKKYRGRFIW